MIRAKSFFILSISFSHDINKASQLNRQYLSEVNTLELVLTTSFKR